MKREVDYCRDVYGEYVFEPAPKGQDSEWMTANEELPTIDNDEVVNRYVKAKLAFEEARDAVTNNLVHPVKTETPFPCSSCLYYKMNNKDCDICKVANLDGTCNYYREDSYGT